MREKTYNVLFLCTGNADRSIIAESLLNQLGQPRFRGYSAGSQPLGTVSPLVLEFLASRDIAVHDARSKTWDEFAAPGAPHMDLVVTVCDQAAGETCPVWPGHPALAHWSAPDPERVKEDPAALQDVIHDVFHLMYRRISLLMSLPVERLDRLALQGEARAIGGQTPLGQPVPAAQP